MTGPQKHDDAHGITRKELLKTRGRRRVGAGATAATRRPPGHVPAAPRRPAGPRA